MEILNSVIRITTKKSHYLLPFLITITFFNYNYPQYFIENDQKIINMKNDVNKFNSFYVKAGPNLAENIPILNSVSTVNNIESNINSMYLNPIRDK